MSGASVYFQAEAEGEWGIGIDDTHLTERLTAELESMAPANPTQSNPREQD